MTLGSEYILDIYSNAEINGAAIGLSLYFDENFHA